MTKVLFGFVAICVCFFQVGTADDQGPASIAELQTSVEKVLQQTDTPGAAVAIVSREKVEWIAGLGLADVAAKKPVTTKTVFRIGSVSKGFAALAALKLQEEGKLELTDTLRQWVPEYAVKNAWDATDPVRLVHLLEHTSGIPDIHFSEYAHNDPTPATLAQALAFAPHFRVARWRPGSRQAYSGVGTALVAAIIEKVSGQRFEDYVRENFFAPLGMKTTSYFLTPEVQSNLTTFYWSGGKKTAPYTHMLYRPAGSANASIEDMANYVRFHLQRGSLDGRRILQEASIDRLEVPRTLPAVQAGVTTGYGLYNLSMSGNGYEWHGHGGSWDGALCFMAYCPELGFGLVVLTNSNDYSALNQIQGLIGHYLMRDIPDNARPPAAQVPASLQRKLDGTYANIATRDAAFNNFTEYFRSVAVVHVDENGMTWQSALGGRPERWVAVSDKLFRLERASKPALAVITGENGELLLQNDRGTFQRISTVGFWLLVGGTGLSIGLLLSAVIFALMWGLGRLKNAGPLSVRVCPLVGAAAVFGIIIFYFQVQGGWLPVLGTPNTWTVGVMVMSLLVSLSAVLSAAVVWRHRRASMNRAVYWHAVLVTVGLIFFTGFGLHWGLIGVRLWA